MMIALPFPPSVNALFGGGSKQKRFPSAAYKAWIKACPKNIVHRAQTPCRLHYTLFWPDARIRDGGNYLKAPLDWLVREKILIDDNWQVVVGETWESGGIDRSNPRVEIQILPARDDSSST